MAVPAGRRRLPSSAAASPRRRRLQEQQQLQQPLSNQRTRRTPPLLLPLLPLLLPLLVSCCCFTSYARPAVPSPLEGPRAFTHFPVSDSAAAAAAATGAVLKTGTTIAGVVVQEAVILAADTRSTMGKVVADKNCEKIHKLSEAIYCCGAGTAADAEQLTAAVRQWLKMESAKSFMSLADQDALPAPRVVAAASGLGRLLFRGGNGDKGGGASAAFVLGGVDAGGAHLYQIESDGTTQRARFTALGSGFAAAMAILEAQHGPNMTVADGVALLHDAITSGILNDMGSGSHVDMCIIYASDGRVEYRRDVRASSPPPSSSPSPSRTTTEAAAATRRAPPSSFLHPRGALAAAAGPRVERADIHRLVGGNVGRGDVRHEPFRPFRRRELRFCQPSDQEEAEAVSTAAAAAVEAVNTAAASRTPGAVKRGGESGPLESSSALGFEVQLSGSPDEDVEVL